MTRQLERLITSLLVAFLLSLYLGDPVLLPEWVRRAALFFGVPLLLYGLELAVANGHALATEERAAARRKGTRRVP
jgi:hypothetical protein